MGYRELIESLRKDGEENINQIWSNVKAEAEKINEETSLKINELRNKYLKKSETEAIQQEESILAEARKRAYRIKLSAEKELSDRLFPLAASSLVDLRDARYKEVFISLIKELPEKSWEEIRVNPQDVGIAQEHFPHAHITPDKSISGGLEVLSNEGRVSISNTLNKRLERAWDDLLPLIFTAIYEEVSDDESSTEA